MELPNTVEGLIHIATLPDDYYYYDENAYEMVGEDSGRRFKLGQRVKVLVREVDTMTRTVNFALVEE